MDYLTRSYIIYYILENKINQTLLPTIQNTSPKLMQDRRAYLLGKRPQVNLFVGEPQPTVPPKLDAEPNLVRAPVLAGDVYIHSDGKQFNLNEMQQISWSGLNNHGTLPYMVVDGCRIPRNYAPLTPYESVTWTHPSAKPWSKLFEVYPGVAIQVPMVRCTHIPSKPYLFGPTIGKGREVVYLVNGTDSLHRIVHPEWEKYPYNYAHSMIDDKKKDHPTVIRIEDQLMWRQMPGAVKEKVAPIYNYFHVSKTRAELEKKKQLCAAIKLFYETCPTYEYIVKKPAFTIDIVVTPNFIVEAEVMVEPLREVFSFVQDAIEVMMVPAYDVAKELNVSFTALESINAVLNTESMELQWGLESFTFVNLSEHKYLPGVQRKLNYPFDVGKKLNEYICCQLRKSSLVVQMICLLNWSSMAHDFYVFDKREMVAEIEEDLNDFYLTEIEHVQLNEEHYEEMPAPWFGTHVLNEFDQIPPDKFKQCRERLSVSNALLHLYDVPPSELSSFPLGSWDEVVSTKWDKLFEIGSCYVTNQALSLTLYGTNVDSYETSAYQLLDVVRKINEGEKLKNNIFFKVRLPSDWREGRTMVRLLVHISEHARIALDVDYQKSGTLDIRLQPGRLPKSEDKVLKWLVRVHAIYNAYFVEKAFRYLEKVRLKTLEKFRQCAVVNMAANVAKERPP